jgi:hypothetical protein
MIDLEHYVAPFDDEPADWEDVLRRAGRRRRGRRLALAVATAALLLGTAPALGVLLTRPEAPQLPRDRITGPVRTVVDPRTGATLLEAGRWKERRGVCYLVPHVRSGCLARGERTEILRPLPLLTHGAVSERGIRLRLHRPAAFAVLATALGVDLRGPDGKLLARIRLSP